MLQYADNAQHSFSSDNRPLLHTALPALEKLHTKWNKKIDDVKYNEFSDAIREAALKISEYYEKTADSDALTFSMCKYISSNFRHDN